MNTLTMLMMLFAQPADAARHTVVYEVNSPAPKELEAFSRFDLTYETVKLADGQTEVTYTMPKLFLGNETEFRFRGIADFSAGSFVLRSDKAEMACTAFPDHALCRVKYRGIPVDLDGVRETLEQMPISPEEKAGRFALSSLVARAGGDFAGLLYFVRDSEFLPYAE